MNDPFEDFARTVKAIKDASKADTEKTMKALREASQHDVSVRAMVARDLKQPVELWGSMVQIAIVAIAAAGGFDG